MLQNISIEEKISKLKTRLLETKEKKLNNKKSLKEDNKENLSINVIDNNNKLSKELIIEIQNSIKSVKELEKMYLDLRKKYFLQKCFSKEIEKNFEIFKSHYSKIMIKEIIFNICKNVQINGLKRLIKRKNENFETKKLYFYNKFKNLTNECNGNKQLYSKHLTLFNKTNELKSKKIKELEENIKEQENEKKDEQIINCKKKINLLTKKLFSNKIEHEKLIKTNKKNIETIETIKSENKFKEKQLKILCDSLKTLKAQSQKKLNERYRSEQKRVDEVIKLQKEEAIEYEKAIEKKDLDLKQLYSKLSSQDETIRKMGHNLLNLSRRSEDSELKKSLEDSKMEILRLKSQLANLGEIKESEPNSIHSALRNGFKNEKECKILRERAKQTTNQLKTLKTELSITKNSLIEAKKSFKSYQNDSEQRNKFFCKVTHCVLKKCKKSLSEKSSKEKLSGLEEMFQIIARCESETVATPRLRRALSRFEGKWNKNDENDV